MVTGRRLATSSRSNLRAVRRQHGPAGLARWVAAACFPGWSGVASVVLARLAILAFAVLGVLFMGGGEAWASHVGCGDTVTSDTTLDSDLAGCPNNGIVIGADGVTLDLAGHRIDGDGAPAVGCDPETEWCDVGVLNEGYDGVTVKAGSLRDFDSGVVSGEARESRLVGISSRRQTFFGALVFGSARTLIRDGDFSRNIPPEGDGIGMFGCRRSRIVDNEIRGNEGPGIHLGDSSNNAVKQNRLIRNGPSIFIEEGDRNLVRDNRIVGGAGLRVGPGDRNVIRENHASRAFESIAIEKGHRNVVAYNLVVDARGGAGISLGINNPPIGGGENVVRRNRVEGSREDGFHVARKDGGSVLSRNTAVGAGDDGFDVQGPSTKLTKNRAVRNDDLGIDAEPGVVDGGGNRARGNGDPRQCVGVVC